MLSSGSNGAASDLLYVLTTAGIKKYSLSSGSWVANGSYASVTGFGLTAGGNGSGTDLFVSTGNGAASANSVIKVTDTAGFNTAIAVTTGNNITLYTAPAGTTVKGVSFVPVAAAAMSVVTITAPDAGAAESPADSGILRFSRTGETTGALDVSYAISTGAGQAASTDFNPTLSGSVTIPAGQSFVDVSITPVDDGFLEGSESVTLTVTTSA